MNRIPCCTARRLPKLAATRQGNANPQPLLEAFWLLDHRPFRQSGGAMAETGPRFTRAQACTMLNIPLARLHSLERIGVCAADEARTYGDTHPALYNWRTVSLVSAVIQAEAFGIKGQRLVNLAKGIQLRRHLLHQSWRGWVIWDHRGPVDLVEQQQGLPNFAYAVALLLIPLDCQALLQAKLARP